MPKTCQLTSVAFSPLTSSAIIKFCDSRQSKEDKWYFGTVKTGMETIIMHRRIFYFSVLMFSLSSMAPDEITFTCITLSSGALMAFSLWNIYSQAKKIQSVIEPYLKVSCFSAEPILMMPQAQATAERVRGDLYGTVKPGGATSLVSSAEAGAKLEDV
jgi:hypothetical protein